MSGKGRSFSREMNDKLRDVARELRRAHKSDRAFAAALGVAQPTVSNFLNGGNAGILLAAHIAQAAGLTLVVDRNGAHLGDVELPHAWRDLAGWEDAVAEARKLFPRVSEAAWDWLGSLSGPPLPGLPPAALAIIAGAYDQVPAVSNTPPQTNTPRSGVQKRAVR